MLRDIFYWSVVSFVSWGGVVLDFLGSTFCWDWLSCLFGVYSVSG